MTNTKKIKEVESGVYEKVLPPLYTVCTEEEIGEILSKAMEGKAFNWKDPHKATEDVTKIVIKAIDLAISKTAKEIFDELDEKHEICTVNEKNFDDVTYFFDMTREEWEELKKKFGC